MTPTASVGTSICDGLEKTWRKRLENALPADVLPSQLSGTGLHSLEMRSTHALTRAKTPEQLAALLVARSFSGTYCTQAQKRLLLLIAYMAMQVESWHNPKKAISANQTVFLN